MADPARSRCSPRASICGSATTRGRCAAAFCPTADSTVEEKVEGLAFERIDLRDGATLERDRPYLVPLIEELRLPADIRAKANPKSSTGRLDVFTRVLTDRNHRFDEIAGGYQGQLYLEVVPRTFAIRVKTRPRAEPGAADSRGRRIWATRSWRLSTEVPAALPRFPAREARPSCRSPMDCSSALTSPGAPTSIVGYRAKKNSLPIDLTQRGDAALAGLLGARAPGAGGRIVLEPEVFYLLLSAEGVCIPPAYAAEMLAYDPTAGELRTHYAGFFDPGFGYTARRRCHGSRAALEVQSSRCGLHGRARPAGVQARVRADDGRTPTCSTARTPDPATRDSRRCSASTSPRRPRGSGS